MNNVLNKVKETIFQHSLIAKGSKVLVALSGGADSVCLLHVLRVLCDEMSFTLYAAHLNHGLRGEEADHDEAFVANLCKTWGIPLFTRRLAVKFLAEQEGCGLEEAGRKARYAFFAELLEEHAIDVVATAHNSCDNVETVIMRLMRGTGINGLAGIPHRNGHVVRPLLDVSREEIEDYCREADISYCLDSTNQDTEFTRNRVRHMLLPMIEESFNPNFKKNFQEQIGLYADCASFIQRETEKLFVRHVRQMPGGCCLECEPLAKEEPFLVMQLLHALLSELSGQKEINMQAVQAVKAITDNQTGSVQITRTLVAEVCYGVLYIRQDRKEQPFCYDINGKEELIISETGDRICIREPRIVSDEPGQKIYVDAKKLAGKKLQVRSRRTGDYFYPTGMEGKKSLQDYFVDKKIPHFMRQFVPILSADDDIVWVIGMRADRRYLAQENQENVLCVTYDKGDNNEGTGTKY
ncbi:MAG: tRNA lysidine(34) synthetase TilS [Ruminococcaceae bacterium]|nr:tRNA lysidine(34) synthetase TilS [Oscillospiraceae bacterium]